MSDELDKIARQLRDERELERAMLQRVRGLVICEYYEEWATSHSDELWLRQRVKK